MTDIETMPAHRFTVGGALGFGFEVLKARPQSVLILLIGQALIYVVLTLGQFILMGDLARQGIQAVEMGNAADAYAVSMQFSSASSLFSLLGLPLWLWLEAVWLTLFMTGRFTLWPGWAGLGRLTLAGLILFGVYIVSLFVLVFVVMIGVVVAMLVAESGTGDSSVAALLTVLALAVLAVFAMIAVLSLFSALPAHALSGRPFEIGAAIRTGRRHLMGATVSWFVFLVLYMLALILSYGAIALMVGDHVVNTLNTVIETPQDPLMSMRLYAQLAPGADQALMSALFLMPVMLVMGVIMLIGRGISAKLALSMPPADEKAD